MATFTLDELAEATSKKFAPTIVKMGEAGDLVLRPLVDLSVDERLEAQRLQKHMSAIQSSEKVYLDENDQEREPTPEEVQAEEDEARAAEPQIKATLHDILRIAAGPAGREYADKFIAIPGAGDSLSTLLTLMQEWGSTGQLGEAPASSSS